VKMGVFYKFHADELHNAETRVLHPPKKETLDALKKTAEDFKVVYTEAKKQLFPLYHKGGKDRAEAEKKWKARCKQLDELAFSKYMKDYYGLKQGAHSDPFYSELEGQDLFLPPQVQTDYSFAYPQYQVGYTTSAVSEYALMLPIFLAVCFLCMGIACFISIFCGASGFILGRRSATEKGRKGRVNDFEVEV